MKPVAPRVANSVRVWWRPVTDGCATAPPTRPTSKNLPILETGPYRPPVTCHAARDRRVCKVSREGVTRQFPSICRQIKWVLLAVVGATA